HAVPVEENATRRGDRANADTVLVGRVEEPATLEHLQVPELADDHHQAKRHHRGDRHHPDLSGIAAAGRGAQTGVESGRWIHEARALSMSLQASAKTSSAPRNPL